MIFFVYSFIWKFVNLGGHSLHQKKIWTRIFYSSAKFYHTYPAFILVWPALWSYWLPSFDSLQPLQNQRIFSRDVLLTWSIKEPCGLHWLQQYSPDSLLPLQAIPLQVRWIRDETSLSNILISFFCFNTDWSFTQVYCE